MDPSRMRLALLAAPLIVAATIGIALLGSSEEGSPDGIASIEVPGEPPLAGGVRVSLGTAISAFELPIYRPDHALASDATIRDIWMEEGDEASVYIRYRGGVVVHIRVSAGHLSTTEWAKELTGDGVDGRTEDLVGIVAFVVDPHYPSLASARFFLGDALVVVIGDGPEFTTDQMRELAVSTIERAGTIENEHAIAEG